MDGKVVRIGCHSGFWGDSSTGAFQLVRGVNKIDYLVGDYLAEVTMGILARLKKQSSGGKGGMGEGGYVAEFVTDVWTPLMKDIVDKNIKVITNAGGMNPVALKKHIESVAAKANINIVVAAISGDDITDSYSNLSSKQGIKPFSVSGEIEHITPNKLMLSCNAYLGAFPIAHALKNGAQVVVTGRTVDSALVLGPLIHEFNWKSNDYDRLAAGSVTGHIIECGCHATGGNFTDWEKSWAFGWDNVGFPIAECFEDGTCIVTKQPQTGGLVSVATVAEQIVYEIHDPGAYVLPDVIVDFRNVRLEEIQKNTHSLPGRVKVTGARGRAPTSSYKASLTFFGGTFKVQAVLMIGGTDARRKAEATAHAILEKTRKMLKSRGMADYDDVYIETLGSEHSYGPHSRVKHTREVVLRLVFSHSDKRALALLSKEVTPAALAMAPGITGGAGGRPHVQPDMLYHSCLVDKQLVPITIHIGDSNQSYQDPIDNLNPDPSTPPPEPVRESVQIAESSSTFVTVPLITLCHGRSGDKGDVANIGIICRDAKYFPLVEKQLTSKNVKTMMDHIIKGSVSRYILPGINAFNFVCTSALGGGGLSSLRMDRQGKCYAQMLLDYPIEVPIKWIQKSKL